MRRGVNAKHPGAALAIINVYVDGFNLYYGALKKTPYKWLDLGKLAQELLPDDTIQEIHYFTARVSSRPYNPTAAHDQGLYIRALKNYSKSPHQVRPLPHPFWVDVPHQYLSAPKSMGGQNGREGFGRKPCLAPAARCLCQKVRGGGFDYKRFRPRRAGTSRRPRDRDCLLAWSTRTNFTAGNSDSTRLS